MAEACPYCLTSYDGDDAEDMLDIHITTQHDGVAI